MSRTYEPIATTTLGTSASEVNFSTIPGTYTDLVIICSILGNVGSPTDFGLRAQFNADTGNNYSRTNLLGNGSSASSGRASNQTYMLFQISGYFSTTNPIPAIIQVMNYSNTTTNKTSLARENNVSASVGAIVNLWRSTSAITSIKLFAESGNFGANSTFTLYGIKAA